MFEVSWQNPAAETVAQHRERKDREEGKSNRKARRPSQKSVDSSDSSRNQRPSVFELFAPQKKGSLPNGHATHGNHGPTLAQKRLASSGTDSALELSDSLTIFTGERSRSNGFIGSHLPDADNKCDSSPDSAFSGWPGRSSTDLSWDSTTDSTSKTYEIQPLTPNSFVSRSTEITISCQDAGAILDRPVNEVHITADAALPQDLDLYPFPVLHGQATLEKSPIQAPKYTKDAPIISPRSKAPDLWKPPNSWDCSPEDSDQEGKSPDSGPQDGAAAQAADPIVTVMQANIRRMAAAGPEVMLQRLREEWPTVKVHKQEEHERALWMLVALRAIITDCNGGQEEDLLPKPPAGPTKVLSLYESKASTSVLASFVDAEVHHLATSTVSPTAFYGIRPITVPSLSVHLPYAPSIFSSISATTLPALLSSSSIPTLLRECYRVLIPNGTLCLTIIDPCPAAATLGPKLRTWLDDHLLLNLEKQFRCTSPGRLLPIWMREVGFATSSLAGTSAADEAAVAKGARVTRTSFSAVKKESGDDKYNENAEAREGELKTLLGRMLWREIWGSFAEAQSWWWEDAAILDECRLYGTRWDCALVRAVKERSNG